MLTTVYRIENKDGYGPYTSMECFPALRKMRDKHNANLNRWPTACSTYILNALVRAKLAFSDCCCGFTSLRQLTEWFDSDDLGVLFDCNFRLAMYEVESAFIVYTEEQILFIRKQADLVCFMDIVDIYDLIKE